MRDEVVRPPTDVSAGQESMELDNHAIYSEPDDSQYIYSCIRKKSITLQANRVSGGEDNTAYPQGNACSELDLSCVVCHEYAKANTNRLEWFRNKMCNWLWQCLTLEIQPAKLINVLGVMFTSEPIPNFGLHIFQPIKFFSYLSSVILLIRGEAHMVLFSVHIFIYICYCVSKSVKLESGFLKTYLIFVL
mgnify:CR=1 FL=1